MLFQTIQCLISSYPLLFRNIQIKSNKIFFGVPPLNLERFIMSNETQSPYQKRKEVQEFINHPIKTFPSQPALHGDYSHNPLNFGLPLISKYSTRTNAKNCSFTWCNILSGWKICSKGIAWNIGNDTCVDFWDSIWLPNNQSLRSMIYGPLTPHDTHKQISEIYTNNSWDLSNLSFALPQEITNLILSINPSLNNNLTDYPYLFLTSNGNFFDKNNYITSPPGMPSNIYSFL